MLQKQCPTHFSTERRDFSKLLENMKDEPVVMKNIEECDKILEEVEDELKKQKAEYGTYVNTDFPPPPTKKKKKKNIYNLTFGISNFQNYESI